MTERQPAATCRKRELISLITIALSIHLLMLIYDIASNFQPFLYGDRGDDRWEPLIDLIKSKPAAYLSHLVEADVGPGEYLFQLPSYLIGGHAGIIIFQILLSLISTIFVYKVTLILVPWKRTPFICALIYLLLPQNIVFPHEFVTEAVSTPLCTLFLYLLVRSLRDNQTSLAVWGAFCYGLAILVRPSLAFALPSLLLLLVLYSIGHWRGTMVRAVAVCAIACLPLACWVTVFTATTGKIGYTSGVATLGWNLRSKVYLVYFENGVPEPPELKNFSNYEQLYLDTGGIGVARYLEIVGEHPWLFAKDALISLGQVLGRGNVTKFFVDYLGIGADVKIKQLPKLVLGAGNLGALLDVMRGNAVIAVLLLEVVFSVVNSCFVLIATGFLLFSLIKPQKVVPRIGLLAFQAMLIIASILFGVIVSGEVADAAQARLRNPVDSGLIILCGLFFFYYGRARWDDRPIAISGLRSPVNADP